MKYPLYSYLQLVTIPPAGHVPSLQMGYYYSLWLTVIDHTRGPTCERYVLVYALWGGEGSPIVQCQCLMPNDQCDYCTLTQRTVYTLLFLFVPSSCYCTLLEPWVAFKKLNNSILNAKNASLFASIRCYFIKCIIYIYYIITTVSLTLKPFEIYCFNWWSRIVAYCLYWLY